MLPLMPRHESLSDTDYQRFCEVHRNLARALVSAVPPPAWPSWCRRDDEPRDPCPILVPDWTQTDLSTVYTWTTKTSPIVSQISSNQLVTVDSATLNRALATPTSAHVIATTTTTQTRTESPSKLPATAVSMSNGFTNASFKLQRLVDSNKKFTGRGATLTSLPARTVITSTTNTTTYSAVDVADMPELPANQAQPEGSEHSMSTSSNITTRGRRPALGLEPRTVKSLSPERAPSQFDQLNALSPVASSANLTVFHRGGEMSPPPYNAGGDSLLQLSPASTLSPMQPRSSLDISASDSKAMQPARIQGSNAIAVSPAGDQAVGPRTPAPMPRLRQPFTAAKAMRSAARKLFSPSAKFDEPPMDPPTALDWIRMIFTLIIIGTIAWLIPLPTTAQVLETLRFAFAAFSLFCSTVVTAMQSVQFTINSTIDAASQLSLPTLSWSNNMPPPAPVVAVEPPIDPIELQMQLRSQLEQQMRQMLNEQIDRLTPPTPPTPIVIEKQISTGVDIDTVQSVLARERQSIEEAMKQRLAEQQQILKAQQDALRTQAQELEQLRRDTMKNPIDPTPPVTQQVQPTQPTPHLDDSTPSDLLYQLALEEERRWLLEREASRPKPIITQTDSHVQQQPQQPSHITQPVILPEKHQPIEVPPTSTAQPDAINPVTDSTQSSNLSKSLASRLPTRRNLLLIGGGLFLAFLTVSGAPLLAFYVGEFFRQRQRRPIVQPRTLRGELEVSVGRSHRKPVRLSRSPSIQESRDAHFRQNLMNSTALHMPKRLNFDSPSLADERAEASSRFDSFNFMTSDGVMHSSRAIPRLSNIERVAITRQQQFTDLIADASAAVSRRPVSTTNAASSVPAASANTDSQISSVGTASSSSSSISTAVVSKSSAGIPSAPDTARRRPLTRRTAAEEARARSKSKH